MRTFNGLQIFTAQLTQSGQLDSRYVRITGDAFINDNLYVDYDLYKNQNFNVGGVYNLFLSDNSGSYTGYLPNITDKRSVFIKIIDSTYPVLLTGYQGQKFDNADSILNLASPVGVTLLGVKTNGYTGWVSVNSTAGIGI
jgi:hypothetical protein